MSHRTVLRFLLSIVLLACTSWQGAAQPLPEVSFRMRPATLAALLLTPIALGYLVVLWAITSLAGGGAEPLARRAD